VGTGTAARALAAASAVQLRCHSLQFEALINYLFDESAAPPSDMWALTA